MKKIIRNHTVAILEKDGQFAAFALDQYEKNPAYVGRFDKRCTPPRLIQQCAQIDDAITILDANIKISENRGWRVVVTSIRNSG